MRTRRTFGLRTIVLVMMLLAMMTTAFAAGDPTDATGTKMIECPDCGAVGVVLSDEAEAVTCFVFFPINYLHLFTNIFRVPSYSSLQRSYKSPQ